MYVFFLYYLHVGYIFSMNKILENRRKGRGNIRVHDWQILAMTQEPSFGEIANGDQFIDERNAMVLGEWWLG